VRGEREEAGGRGKEWSKLCMHIRMNKEKKKRKSLTPKGLVEWLKV
jgi:hypothetical protein